MSKKIYIDFDDVICETAKYFTILAKELFGIELPYSQVQFFNLKKAFGLDDEQYDQLMKAGHLPENLLAYQETPGAADTINRWIDEGHEVFIITGRPFDAYEPSRRWLDEHGLERVPLFCVDKYGRENFLKDSTYNLTLDDLYNMTFDFAIEDSPAAFQHVLHFENCKVAVFDRPWNQDAQLPGENFVRCSGWQEIDELLKNYDDEDKPEWKKRPKKKKHRGALFVVVLLLLGILAGLFFYSRYQDKQKRLTETEFFYQTLTEEVTAKAYVWLSQIENMPYTYEELRELMGEVTLEITVLPTEQEGIRENWIAEGAYEKCKVQVDRRFADIYRQILTYRLREAGFLGEITNEALDKMMQDAYGPDVAGYLAEYGPELLPSLEECMERYAGEVTYE